MVDSKVFLRDKPPMVLVYLRDKRYHPKSHTDIGCIYSHLMIVLKKLEVTGLATIEKSGRKRVVKLTEKGKLVADEFKKIKRLIG